MGFGFELEYSVGKRWGHIVTRAVIEEKANAKMLNLNAKAMVWWAPQVWLRASGVRIGEEVGEVSRP